MSIIQRHVKIVPEVKIVDNCYNSTLEEIVPHVPLVKKNTKSTQEKVLPPQRHKIHKSTVKRRKPRLDVAVGLDVRRSVWIDGFYASFTVCSSIESKNRPYPWS